MKNTIVDGIFTEDINLNTLMRLISNKQNSIELIKLSVKVHNSIAFYIYRTLRNWKIYKSCNFLEIFT